MSDADTDPLGPVTLSWGPLLEAHPLAHFVYDTHSLRLLAANDAALARYGYSRAEFTALHRPDLLLPGEVPVLRAFLAQLPGSATAPEQHVWLERTRDGRVLHADVRGMPVLFEGRPARLAAVVDAGSRARLAADAAGARDLLVVAGRMAQLGGWRIDLATQRGTWSDEVCALHEVPEGSEFDLAATAAFYPGEAAKTITQAARRCAVHGTPFDLELPFVGARGTARWVRVVGAAARDSSGAIVAIDGALQDITERHHNAEALADSRSRLAALMDAFPDLWIVLDAELRYAEVSDPTHAGLSTPWAHKLGRDIANTMDPANVATVRRLVAAAHATGRPQSYYYDLRTQGGEMRSYEGRFVPLSAGRTLKLVRDVTETVELERRFHMMADAAPVGIFMTDTVGACTYCNAAWQQLYGLSGEAAMGQAWARVVHPEDRARMYGEWLNSATTNRSFEAEFRLLRGDGSERTVFARSNPLHQAGGVVTGHVGTVVDVTHARELEAARRAQAVAEETGRRQAVFMSRVSHELRTPLNAILGFAQLLQQAGSLPAPRAQTYAEHVLQAGRHMLTLVDDLLELQRLEQGRLQVQLVSFQLFPVLAACLDLLRPAADAADVELLLQVPAELRVSSDERCLRQMVLNLCSNAVKYGRQPGVPGQVVLAAAANETGGVLLTVADGGPGMTPAQLQRLFQPFERLGQEAGSLPGTGLGLVITRQLAHAVGADITVASQPGQGTVATLRLPP